MFQIWGENKLDPLSDLKVDLPTFYLLFYLPFRLGFQRIVSANNFDGKSQRFYLVLLILQNFIYGSYSVFIGLANAS